MQDKYKYLTKKELANLLDVALSTIDKWLSKGLPYKEKGSHGKTYKFYLPDVVKWIQTTKNKYWQNRDIDDLTLEEVRKRKELAEAEIKELELAEKRGSLVPIEKVKNEAAGLATIVKQRLYSIPNKIAPFCYKKSINEIKQIIYDAIDEAIEDLHKNREKWKKLAEKVLKEENSN